MQFTKLVPKSKVLLVTAFFALLLNGSLAQASAQRPASNWLNKQTQLNDIGSIAFNETDKPKDIRTITANLVNIFLGLLGVIFLGLMVAAGVIWMTAAGNESKLETARKLMLSGVIGLLIILASFAITLYVTSRITQSVRYNANEVLPEYDINGVPIPRNERFNAYDL